MVVSPLVSDPAHGAGHVEGDMRDLTLDERAAPICCTVRALYGGDSSGPLTDDSTEDVFVARR
jgi:hypothetical protein